MSDQGQYGEMGLDFAAWSATTVAPEIANTPTPPILAAASAGSPR
jgi:hypothetical protein